MTSQQPLQKKRDQLETKLSRNIQRKLALESKINQEFEELKKTEISLEMLSEQGHSETNKSQMPTRTID